MLISLLLHLVLALLIVSSYLINPEDKKQEPEKQAMEVQLVPNMPKSPPPPTPTSPPPPPPQPQEQPQPPPPPKPQPPPPSYKPPPKPMLEEGKIDKVSKATNHTWLDDADGDDQPKPSPTKSTSLATLADTLSTTKGGRRSDNVGPATQTERDYLLAQVIKNWHNRPNFNWPDDLVIHLRVSVLPSGYLATPFNAQERYMPGEAIIDYDSMGRNDPRRILLESLYVALRVAQPLTLPPELKAKAPFETVLDFKLADVP